MDSAALRHTNTYLACGGRCDYIVHEGPGALRKALPFGHLEETEKQFQNTRVAVLGVPKCLDIVVCGLRPVKGGNALSRKGRC